MPSSGTEAVRYIPAGYGVQDANPSSDRATATLSGERSSSNGGRFVANLHRVGLVVADTERLLSEFNRTRDWAAVVAGARAENLLAKTGSGRTKAVLDAIERRYLSPPDWLPDTELVARFFTTAVPVRAKAQVAFVYLVAEDALARRCLASLVLERPTDRQNLYTADIVRLLEDLRSSHPELDRWSASTLKRWSQGFLSVLREIGFVERGSLNRLIDPVIMPEAFAFVLAWLVERTGSAKMAIEHDVFGLLALDATERRALLAEGQRRGWWRYAELGGAMELALTHGTIEELIDALG